MTNPQDEIEKLIDDIYGKNVTGIAYASPAGKITKLNAKAAIEKLILEAQRKD